MCKDLDDELKEYDCWENDNREERRGGEEQKKEIRVEQQEVLDLC